MLGWRRLGPWGATGVYKESKARQIYFLVVSMLEFLITRSYFHEIFWRVWKFHSGHSSRALIFIPCNLLFDAIISYVNVPLSLSTSKPRILVWPLQLQVVWGRDSTSLQPQHSTTHPHPSTSITVGHPTSLCHGGMVVPPPDPILPPSPQTLSVSLEVWGWEMRTCVCVGGGGG